MSKYPELVLYPVHPATVSRMRAALYPSSSKDDPKEHVWALAKAGSPERQPGETKATPAVGGRFERLPVTVSRSPNLSDSCR